MPLLNAILVGKQNKQIRNEDLPVPE